MAAKGTIHFLLFVQSVFLYYAVLRLRETARVPPCTPPRPPAGPASPEPARTIYVVTPTYTRATQLADLTRLANTLRLVPGVHWLVAEDRNVTSLAVTELLLSSGLSYTQLAAVRPPELLGKVIGRGVFNRSVYWTCQCRGSHGTRNSRCYSMFSHSKSLQYPRLTSDGRLSTGYDRTVMTVE